MKEIAVTGLSTNLILGHLSSSVVFNKLSLAKFKTIGADPVDFEVFIEKVDASRWYSPTSFSPGKTNPNRCLILMGTIISKEREEYNNRKCKIKIYFNMGIKLQIYSRIETYLIRVKYLILQKFCS